MNIPSNIHYIAIEGAIGVGKTTLARMLVNRWQNTSDHSNITLLEENFIENPFLEKFYLHPEEYAFQTQLFFLISRQKDMVENIAQGDLFRPLIVSDYTFDKDRIFALQTLKESEFSMYETVSNALGNNLPKPDMIIYLQASIDTMMQRIKHRNREMEKNISREYLQGLQVEFDHYFWHYRDCPVLVINTDKIDFVKYPEHFEELASFIETWPLCTTFFAPEGNV